jgi:DNA primase
MGRGFGAHANPVPGNIPACLDELGISYRMAGDECTGICPSPDHDDRKPSWSVNVETGTHNCFSCDFQGNFVHLVENYLGIDRLEAVAWCRKRGGVERAKMLLNKERVEPRRPETRESELALFVPPPTGPMSKRLLTAEACEEYGVLWDRGKEAWVTPIRDPYDHRLWGWQEKNERLFRNRPRNVPKSKTLFGLDAFSGGTAILVESPLDAVRLRSVGLRGGLASFGVGVSEEQLRIITEYADELVLALDNDKAGVDKTREIRRSFRRIPVRVFHYGKSGSKDPGEMGADEIKRGIRLASAHS